MSEGHTVYVVDDNNGMRRSLRLMLAEAGYLVRTFESGPEFLEAAEHLPSGLVLLDLRMAGLDGLQTLQLILKKFSKFACVMITGHGDVERAVESIKNGAKDFLEKPFREDALLAVLEREFAALESAAKLAEVERQARALVGSLSRRERDVFLRMVRGLQNKTIAHELGLSVRTVEMHRARVMQRLRCTTLAGVINLAIHSGDAVNPPVDGS